MPRISAPTVAEHRQQVQLKIFTAWASLIAERGYDALTLADVAAAAGVGRTAMYNYYADKESLLLAYASWQMEKFLAELQDELAAATSPSGQLRVFIRHHLADFSTRPLVPGPQLATLVGDQAYEALARHVAPLEDCLRDIIAAGVDAGEFAVSDAGSAAAMAIACIGAERLPLGMGVHTLDDSVEQVYGFLSGALGATTSAGPPTPAVAKRTAVPRPSMARKSPARKTPAPKASARKTPTRKPTA